MCGGMIVIGETSSTYSSSSSWGWLCRTLSLSSLKGPSSLLGKSDFAVSSSLSGWADEVGFTAGVRKYGWGWSSVASNVCESNKLVENGAERSWVKEDVFGSYKFCCAWVKEKVFWIALDVCE